MRILVLYPYVPYPLSRGTYHRVFNLARELGRRHEVDMFCLESEEVADEAVRGVFGGFCRRFEAVPFEHQPWRNLLPHRIRDGMPSTIRRWTCESAMEALEKFCIGSSYDLVHFCDLVMWQYAERVREDTACVMDRSRVDLLFQTEELANLRLSFKERFLRRENLWKLQRYERKVARELRAMVVCGVDDREFLRVRVPDAREVKVLPNGVDAEFFSRDIFPPRPDPSPTILFCGAMDYSPNVSGLDWYFRKCDPQVRRCIPERRILIVGKSPGAEVEAYGRLEGVEVTGGVPDVRPYYQRSWVQMVPLLIGGGTRLKIVESLSLGIPVVSTPIGAQGLDLVDGEHLLLGEPPGAFAGRLVEILSDEGLRGRVADCGRQRVLERYTWPKLGGELSGYYGELLAVSPPVGPGGSVA